MWVVRRQRLKLQVANFELGSAIGFHLGHMTQFPRKRSYQVLQKCVITGYLVAIFMVRCTAESRLSTVRHVCDTWRLQLTATVTPPLLLHKLD